MDSPNPSRMSFRASTGESGLRLLPEMFKLRLNQLAEETLESLQSIWKEAGYEDIECQRLLGDLLAKLKIACANELIAEEKILEHAKLQVETNIADLVKMNEQLGRVAAVDHLEAMNYTDKLTELDRMLQEIGVEVAGRQALIDKEMSGINLLVKELGEIPPTESTYNGPPGTPALSDVRLNLMKNHKKELQQIKVKRVEEVQLLAKECYVHMCDLMYPEEGFSTMEDSQAFLAIDKQIVKFAKTGDFTMGISKKDVTTLSLRFKRLLEEKELRRNELEKTGAEIAKLWSLLRIPSAEREQFQNSFKKNLSLETLNKGSEELKRLREIRRRSLGRVIGSIRNDILTLWEEAGIDSEDNRRREFPMYFNDLDSLDDTAVDKHESYFTSLRARVEELKPILIKISRRETVIQERIELEHLQTNPERLTARGPNAREDRKREESMQNRVKNLEKITKEIVNQISTWEETNGPFMYGGERYLERIPKQEEQYQEIKESLRSTRRKKDGKLESSSASSIATITSTRSLSNKRQNTTMSGTSAPSTPFSTTKHKTIDQSILSSATQNPPQSDNSGIAQLKDSENRPPSSNIRATSPFLRIKSNESIISTSTQIKERDSQGSDTIVNSH